MNRALRLYCTSLAAFLGLFAFSRGVMGGPNLVAVGSFDLPYAEAEGRESLTEKEIYYEFEGEHDFGRVVVQTTSPHSMVRTGENRMRVGYSGSALLVDYNNAQLENRKVSVWFRVDGKLRAGRTYEYVFSAGPLEQDLQGGIPAILPAFWADGKLMGTEVTLSSPVLGIEAAERIQREIYIRGKVRLENFQQQTGGAWLVLNIPPEVNRGMFFSWVSFREIDEDLQAGQEAEMPVPVRYIPISRSFAGRIVQVVEYAARGLLNRQNEDYSWGGGSSDEIAIITARVVRALSGWKRPPNPEDPDDNRNRIEVDRRLARARDYLAGLKAASDAQSTGGGGGSGGAPPSNPSGGSNRGGGRGGNRGGGGPPPRTGGGAPQGDDSPADLFLTEAVAARLACLSQAPDPSDYNQVINADVEWLSDAQMDDGGWATFSRIVEPNRARLEHSDNASTERAIIALREAHFAGVACEKKLWTQAAKYCIAAQAKDGGFRAKLDAYGGLGEPTNVLRTASGITSMLTTLDLGYGAMGTSCTTYLANKDLNRGIANAIDWMDKNYGEYFQASGALDPNAGFNPFLIAAAVQQLDFTSGISRFNGRDHFLQEAVGDPERRDPGILDYFDFGTGLFANDIHATALGLYMLNGGGAPTVMKRIAVSEEPATQNSADVPHLVRFMMTQRRTLLNWDRAAITDSVQELLKAPIMLVKVSGPLLWETQEWNKLREYSSGGGVVVLELSDDQADQRSAIEARLKETFPEYALRDLAADDPVLTTSETVTPTPKAKVLNNGFRNFLYFAQENWSCAWHLNRVKENANLFQFMNNVLTTVTGGEKLRGTYEPPTYEVGAKPAHDIAVAYLESGAAVPAYPDMVKSLDRLMQANYRVKVSEAADSDAAPATLMWLSVAGRDPMNAETRNRVKKHLDAGGFLMADVISGDVNWAEQLNADLVKLDAGLSLKRLRQSESVYTGEIPGTQGFDVRRVHLRQALHTPFSEYGRCDLYALLKHDTMIGVVSHHDLVSGIGYHLFPDCRGVMPDDARKLAMNTVLTAMYRNKEAEAASAAH